MKKQARFLAMLLALAIIAAAFAGCSSKPSELTKSETQAVESPKPEPTQAVPEDTETEPAASQDVVPLENEATKANLKAGIPAADAAANERVAITDDGYELPLFADTLKISYWMPVEHDLATLVTTYEDMDSYKWVEENLNVDISWTQCSVDAQSEQFNLMCASQEYCDLIDGVNSLYTGGGDAAVADEVIISLDDYIYDYMPFYTSYFANGDLRKAVLSDLGNLTSVFQIRKSSDPSLTDGPVVRLDWLEECGLEWNADNLPTTIDDWHTILSAFNDKYDAVTLWSSTGVQYVSSWGIVASLPGGSGPETSTTADGFYYKDGEIAFGPTSDEFREYAQTIAKWYAEGLIDHDFLTDTSRSHENNMYADNKIGLWKIGNVQDAIRNIENIEQVLTAIPYPSIDENSFIANAYRDYAMNNNTSISTQCANPEDCMIFLDWFFSYEGSMLATFGLEGVTYNVDENGDILLTDLVLNNPDGLNDKVTICLYSTFGAYLYDVRYDEVGLTDMKVKWYNIWLDSQSETTPEVEGEAFTPDEAAEQNQLLVEIGTYAGATFLKWIIGDEALTDESWNSYVESCESLGVSRAIELEKIAVERYKTM